MALTESGVFLGSIVTTSGSGSKSLAGVKASDMILRAFTDDYNGDGYADLTGIFSEQIAVDDHVFQICALPVGIEVEFLIASPA